MEHPQSFIRRYVFSTDHKVIGIQYIVTGLVMAGVGALLAVMIRLQLGWPTVPKEWLGAMFPQGMPGGIMTPEFYLALVTMHGTIMVFFFISYVLVSGFGNYLIPLQIGARDMAFPFLNMLSYWIALLSAAVMLLSFLVEGGAAAAGWTAYPPLSAIASASPGSGLDQTVWLLSMALFIVSFTMSGLNYIATIFSMRAPGMSMMRMPLTVWSYFISAILGVLAFPPLTAAAIMLLFDRHLGTSFFLPGGLVVANQLLPHQGGSPLLWQHCSGSWGILRSTCSSCRRWRSGRTSCRCSAPGFLDSGLTVFASTLPRPARRGHVAPERDFDSGISPASTARCTFA